LARAFAVNGNLPDFVGNAGRFQLFLGFTDGCDFRIGVDHRWDRVVIYVPRATRNPLGAGDRLIFRLVRQHGAFAHVADAQTPGTLVWKWSSVTTRPRESRFTPASSSPSPSVYGRRPIATRITSASKLSRAPALGRFDRNRKRAALLLDSYNLGARA
jgi:hypothetical protein